MPLASPVFSGKILSPGMAPHFAVPGEQCQSAAPKTIGSSVKTPVIAGVLNRLTRSVTFFGPFSATTAPFATGHAHFALCPHSPRR
jgi:hypothetical protein